MRFTNNTILAVIATAVSLCVVPTTRAFTTTNNNNAIVVQRTGRQSTPSFLSSSSKLAATDDEAAVAVVDTGAVILEGDYLAAYEGSLQQLENFIPKTKQPMFDLLGHFVKEYIGASQVAGADAEASSDDSIYSAKASAGRILKGIELAAKLGTVGLPTHFTFDVAHTAYRGRNQEAENGNEYDFYKFGCDFFRPCINLPKSKVLGDANIKKAFQQIQDGENVVFLSNHQSEADPQVVSVCLGELFENSDYEEQAAEITYVAGHKVTTDPLAIPFSMGRNLICIHSKKHIDTDPDTKGAKQRENLKAMSAMLRKLKQGGCALWVAPGGGRDRRDADTGEVPIAPFDNKTIDMFRLMGNKSKKPTHYYPMSIVSYDLCPPPDYVVAGVGEERNVRYVPVGVMVGEELIEDKEGMKSASKTSRTQFSEAAMKACEVDYQKLSNAIH